MKIAFLTAEYVTESCFYGGLANYLYRIALLMKQRDHHIEIFTNSDRNETIFHERITVHRIKAKNNLFKLINFITRYRFQNSLFILFLSYYLRKNLLRRHNLQHFDIVQSSSYLASGLLSTFDRPAPIITRVSSYEPLWRKYYDKNLTLDQRLMEWLELVSMRRSNSVYAPSKFLSRCLREKENLEVDVLPPPFLIETYINDAAIYEKYLSGKKYLLFFGCIGLLKGCEVLAHSLPGILSQYPDMYFVFIGKDFGGPDSNSMMKYIFQKAAIYKNKIIYIEAIKHSQLYPIIEYSKAVVLPSLVDNLPNAMLESMALGKVVIGTHGTSFDELIEDGISGILVEPNNPLELSKAIKRVWNMSDEEREIIGKAACERIANLSPKKICSDLEEHFQKFVR